MKLEIQEDPVAARCELLDKRRSLAREQSAADLETANRSAQLISERARLGGGVDIEGDEQLFHTYQAESTRFRARVLSLQRGSF
jgi:hypothetical protein